MGSSQGDSRALIDALAADARGRAGTLEVPSPEQLLAYHLGELGPAEEERIGRLLVASPAAARRLLEVVELAEARPPTADPADFAAAAAWKRLSGELDRERAAPAPSRRPPSRAARLLAPLAASFGFLAAGAGWWQAAQMGVRVAELETQLQQPVANLATFELPETTRSENLSFKLAAPGSTPARFVLEVSKAECAPFEVELTGPDGQTHQVPGLVPDKLGNLNVFLLAPPAGSYHLELFGCQTRHELLRRTDFEIVPGSG